MEEGFGISLFEEGGLQGWPHSGSGVVCGPEIIEDLSTTAKTALEYEIIYPSDDFNQKQNTTLVLHRGGSYSSEIKDGDELEIDAPQNTSGTDSVEAFLTQGNTAAWHNHSFISGSVVLGNRVRLSWEDEPEDSDFKCYVIYWGVISGGTPDTILTRVYERADREYITDPLVDIAGDTMQFRIEYEDTWGNISNENDIITVDIGTPVDAPVITSYSFGGTYPNFAAGVSYSLNDIVNDGSDNFFQCAVAPSNSYATFADATTYGSDALTGVVYDASDSKWYYNESASERTTEAATALLDNVAAGATIWVEKTASEVLNMSDQWNAITLSATGKLTITFEDPVDQIDYWIYANYVFGYGQTRLIFWGIPFGVMRWDATGKAWVSRTLWDGNWSFAIVRRDGLNSSAPVFLRMTITNGNCLAEFGGPVNPYAIPRAGGTAFIGWTWRGLSPTACYTEIWTSENGGAYALAATIAAATESATITPSASGTLAVKLRAKTIQNSVTAYGDFTEAVETVIDSTAPTGDHVLTAEVIL